MDPSRQSVTRYAAQHGPVNVWSITPHGQLPLVGVRSPKASQVFGGMSQAELQLGHVPSG